jgi:putative ABC transport system permease protein
LSASPGFALTAVLTLALAIAGTTTMVGVLDAVLLRPLPLPSPDRLVMVWTEIPSENVSEGRSAFGTVDEWRRRSRSFEGLAVLDPVSVALTHEGDTGPASGARVSPDLFSLLGVVPARGRFFTDREADERQRLAVISHRLWQARFAGSDDAVGTTVLIDGAPSRIVGVLPAAFEQAGFGNDVWEPHTLFPDWQAQRAAIGRGAWFVFGRLRPGVTFATARDELAAIDQQLGATQPGAAAVERSVRVVSMRERLAGPRSRAVVAMLTGAALLLWLVSAVNVAGLSLARGLGRLPQLAIQVALGASRGHLVRALAAESVALGLMAGAVGFGLAFVSIRALRAVGPAYAPRGAARTGHRPLRARWSAWPRRSPPGGATFASPASMAAAPPRPARWAGCAGCSSSASARRRSCWWPAPACWSAAGTTSPRSIPASAPRACCR